MPARRTHGRPVPEGPAEARARRTRVGGAGVLSRGPWATPTWATPTRAAPARLADPHAAFLHRPRSFTKRRPPAWPSACPRRTFAPSRGVSGQVLQQLLSPPLVHRSVQREKTDFVWPVSSASWDKPVFRKHIAIGASCPHFRNQGFEGSAPPDAARCLKRFFPPARSRSLPSSAPPPPAQAAPRQKPVQSPNPPLFAQPRSPPAFVTSTAGAARAPWRQRPESE